MPQGVKRVPSSWAARGKEHEQGWRTLAQCLGYSTPYLETPRELDARIVRNFTGEDECTSSTESDQT